MLEVYLLGYINGLRNILYHWGYINVLCTFGEQNGTRAVPFFYRVVPEMEAVEGHGVAPAFLKSDWPLRPSDCHTHACQ